MRGVWGPYNSMGRCPQAHPEPLLCRVVPREEIVGKAAIVAWDPDLYYLCPELLLSLLALPYYFEYKGRTGRTGRNARSVIGNADYGRILIWNRFNGQQLGS